MDVCDDLNVFESIGASDFQAPGSRGGDRITGDGELVIDRRKNPSFVRVIEATRRYLVTSACEDARWNQAAAARALGITRSRLNDWFHALDIRPPNPDDEDPGAAKQGKRKRGRRRKESAAS